MKNKTGMNGSNGKQPNSPPVFAEKLLSFFLPSSLRDPILGDLEEEFDYLINSNRSLIDVNRWYWMQALKSACLFLWQQRGTVMAYLISVIFFGLIVGMGIATTDFGFWYILPPPLIATIPASILLGIGATSFQAAKKQSHSALVIRWNSRVKLLSSPKGS